MVSPELSSSFHTSPMANNLRHNARTKSSYSFFVDNFLLAGSALLAMLVLWIFYSFMGTTTQNQDSTFSNPIDSNSKSTITNNNNIQTSGFSSGLEFDPPDKTFYDDPKMGYTMETKIENWDEKRKVWLKKHQSFASGVEKRVFLVTGSQPSPCKNPIGDHLLLRFFKNKVDYCRIHGYDIFYNNVLLQPKMFTYWAKQPSVKAAMLAHPEAEWIWWVDSDAAFTDMEFKLPLERYRDHNLVVHGWNNLIYEEKSWTSLNAGVFLMRNCQWSMDFLDIWSKMGPQSKEYEKWGEILKTTFKDKIFPESDDQSGLVYLLLKEKEKLGGKIYVESEFYFEGYWMEIVGKFDNITEKYIEIEKQENKLRRMHAEKVNEAYGNMREHYLKDVGFGLMSLRRPFITHFTGCQPCSGAHNQMYSGQSCWDAMNRALNFADNQVLRNYGFVHQDLLDSSTVSPLPFDYPA
ncbi:transferase [Lithospermum erythrorhizon]|uniref:Transferase n=1 Tax=Lithospermum erythrorhizon TaxID=34254 RepID=A0AAV3RUJ8_LITER